MIKLNNNIISLCDLSYDNPIGGIIVNYLIDYTIQNKEFNIFEDSIKYNNYYACLNILNFINNKELFNKNIQQYFLYSIKMNNNSIIYLILKYIYDSNFIHKPLLEKKIRYKYNIEEYANPLCIAAFNGNIKLCNYLLYEYNCNIEGYQLINDNYNTYESYNYDEYYDSYVYNEYSNNSEYNNSEYNNSEYNNSEYNNSDSEYSNNSEYNSEYNSNTEYSNDNNSYNDEFDEEYYNPGITPLINATYKNNFKMVKFLLKNGADPNNWGYIYDLANKQNYQNPKTALHIAIEKKYYKLAKLLIYYGALPFKRFTYSIEHEFYTENKIYESALDLVLKDIKNRIKFLKLFKYKFNNINHKQYILIRNLIRDKKKITISLYNSNIEDDIFKFLITTEIII
jgi:hypothetical protein